MKNHPLEVFKYCPKCGSELFEVHNAKSKHCSNCGFTYYQNPSSATAAFILNSDGELLVVQRGKEPAKGTLDLPGGFVDNDESGEQGIIREIKEETGLTLTQYQLRGRVNRVQESLVTLFCRESPEGYRQDVG